MKSCATGVSVRFFNVTIPNAPAMGRKVDRQHLDGASPVAKSQDRFRSDFEEAAFCDKSDPRDAGCRDHGGAGKLKSRRGKRIGYRFAGDIARRRQRPSKC